MSSITVTYTFSANTTAASGEVNQNFSDLVNYINNRNDGSATWDAVYATSSSNNPVLRINNGTGTNSIAIFQDNGSNALTIADGGAVQVLLGDLTVTRSSAGADVISQVTNSENTNGASNAFLLISNGGSSGGDAYTRYTITGVQHWVVGVDNSDSDAFVVSASSAIGTTNALKITTSGTTTIPLGDFSVVRSNDGSPVISQASNSSNTASSEAYLFANVAGSSAGDAYIRWSVTGVKHYVMGIDNSDSDILKISASSIIGTTNILRISNTAFDPEGAGSVSTGDASNYWNDISYKTLTDRGCLPWADNGVELQDGRIVSDCEALAEIKKHPTKKTVHGLPMLDYATFPKVSYKKAEKDGALLPRDASDEPVGGSDGVEMTSMFGFMIGAIKELHNRVKTLEAI